MLVILGFNLRTYDFHLPYKLGFIAALYIQRIATEPQLPISNKCFINGPAKEKAKTYKLSFGRISESDGDISV